MTRDLSRRQSAILGLVVLVCLAIGVWGLFRVSDKSGRWSDGIDLTVLAADAPDVEPGTPVRVRGVEAGRVTAVEDAGDEVRIQVRLDGKYRDRLHSDAAAAIHTKGVLGVSVVDIKPGTPAKGPLEEPVVRAVPTPDLAAVTAKLDSVATRTDALLKDVQDGKGSLPKLLKDEAVYDDLKSTTAEAKKLVKNLDETTTALRSDAQKTLKGVDDSVASMKTEVEGMKTFVRSGQEAVTAIKQDAEAVKAMPIVRSYVEDPVSDLVRPDFDKDRVLYSPDALFEPGTSFLTDDGRRYLDESAEWLKGQRTKGTEIVVAVFADPKSPDLTAASGRELTKKQAEAIVAHFRDRGVHKMGYVARREVKAVGLGFDPSPVAEKDPLSPSRVEVILFVPRR